MGSEYLADVAAKLKANLENEEMSWMPAPGLSTGPDPTPRMQAIQAVLFEDMTLITPCWEWLMAKRAEIMRVKLIILYGEERAAEMIAAARQAEEEQGGATPGSDGDIGGA